MRRQRRYSFRWLDAGVIRSIRQIGRIACHRNAIHDRLAADKARLLRERTQRPAASGRRVNERAGDVIAHRLERRSVEVRRRKVPSFPSTIISA